MPLLDTVLLRKRFIIETLFEVLKSSMGLEHTRHWIPHQCPGPYSLLPGGNHPLTFSASYLFGVLGVIAGSEVSTLSNRTTQCPECCELTFQPVPAAAPR